MCTLIGRLPNAPLDPAFSVGVSCGCSPCRWKIIMHLASVEHGASQANLNLIVLARFSAAFSSITQSDSLHRRVARAWQTDDLRARLSINQIPLETVYNGPKTNYMTSFVDVELGSRDNRNNTNKKATNSFFTVPGDPEKHLLRFLQNTALFAAVATSVLPNPWRLRPSPGTRLFGNWRCIADPRVYGV